MKRVTVVLLFPMRQNRCCFYDETLCLQPGSHIYSQTSQQQISLGQILPAADGGIARMWDVAGCKCACRVCVCVQREMQDRWRSRDKEEAGEKERDRGEREIHSPSPSKVTSPSGTGDRGLQRQYSGLRVLLVLSIRSSREDLDLTIKRQLG